MARFDRYVMVDWSASSVPSPARPKKDALWVGVSAPDRCDEVYFRTRGACLRFVREQLDVGDRVLLGFDFSFGYPAGFAAALGLSGAPPWRLVWDLLRDRVEDDGDTNHNNRFALAGALNERLTPPGAAWGPFWARPAGLNVPTVSPTSPNRAAGRDDFVTRAGARLATRRLAERRLPKAHAVWKLYAPGSVGGQTLLGIHHLARLRDQRSDDLRVWPFETGFTPMPSARVLLAEIWPGLLDGSAKREIDAARRMGKGGPIVDQLQVRHLCAWLRALDRDGALGDLFTRPPDLTDLDVATCIDEEGWVLGVR